MRLYTVIAIARCPGQKPLRWEFRAAAATGPDAEAVVRAWVGKMACTLEVVALPSSGAVELVDTAEVES